MNFSSESLMMSVMDKFSSILCDLVCHLSRITDNEGIYFKKNTVLTKHVSHAGTCLVSR